MTTSLFGDQVGTEGVINLVYKGDSFSGGQMQIRTLYIELESLESVIKKALAVLVETGRLEPKYKNVEIYVQVGEGSVSEVIKIIFSTSVLSTMASHLIVNLLTDTYRYFLDPGKFSAKTEFSEEIGRIKENKQFRDDLKNVISPINKEGDTFVIQDNSGTINIFTVPEKKQIVENLESVEVEDPLLKNGEFQEVLTGVIRKLDLDASGGNYFGFTIDDGQAKVPASLKGEFHLSDIKNIIDEHIQIEAIVKYKNDEIKHIEILNYKLISVQEKIDFQNQ